MLGYMLSYPEICSSARNVVLEYQQKISFHCRDVVGSLCRLQAYQCISEYSIYYTIQIAEWKSLYSCILMFSGSEDLYDAQY